MAQEDSLMFNSFEILYMKNIQECQRAKTQITNLINQKIKIAEAANSDRLLGADARCLNI